LVVELYTAKQLIGSEVKEFMANTKLKKAHNLINNVFTKNTAYRPILKEQKYHN